jgi:hypothetical protein
MNLFTALGTRRSFAALLITAFGLLWLTQSCRQEEIFINDSSAKLSFSVDTLRFDTVFTTIGSATRYFKVRNPYSQSVKISKIALKNRSTEIFNLNVDGISAKSFTDVTIAPNDSIYVFVETLINPNQAVSASPFVINEEVLFELNGKTQSVVLEAWGQNAIYIPSRFGQGGNVVIDCRGGVVSFDDPKPYVIYGQVGVANGTLRLPAGTRIYIHGGISRFTDSARTQYNDGLLYVNADARIVSEGTFERPVLIQGDRLEPEFKDEAGQYFGVYISPKSQNNSFTYTNIFNSKVGLFVDSAVTATLKNCKIYNISASGVYARHATMTLENCLFYNNGGNCFQAEFGGSYTFNHCTLASYGVKSAALSMNNVRCYERSSTNPNQCLKALTFPLNSQFTNCIVFGSQEDQISLFDATTTPNDFNYLFKNCIVRVKKLLETNNTPDFLNFCQNCQNLTSTAKLFKSTNDDNYHLDTLSVASKKAIPIATLRKDLDQKDRDAAMPDVGCYEFVPR